MRGGLFDSLRALDPGQRFRAGRRARYYGPVARRRLPIGMQTFREVREKNCYYVDKTAYIERLVDSGKHYFLSRPRRFGKSLLLDTIKELFEGNEPLFEGLHVHDGWNWSQRHAVVRLDFGGGSFAEPRLLEANVMEQLAAAERRMGVAPDYLTAPGRFAYLLEALHRQTGQTVVVLVDEYDKPILDTLSNPEVRERRYAEKYRATGEPIHLAGVEFSRASRNITAFETADS